MVPGVGPSLGVGLEVGRAVIGAPEARAVPRYSPVGTGTGVGFAVEDCPGGRTGTLTSVFTTLALGAVAWSSGLRLTPATALLVCGRAPFDKPCALPDAATGGFDAVAAGLG